MKLIYESLLSRLQLLAYYFSGKYIKELNTLLSESKFNSKLELFEEMNKAKKDIEKSLQEVIILLNIDFDETINYSLIKKNLPLDQLLKACNVGVQKNETI